MQRERTILLVEDDVSVRSTLRLIIEHLLPEWQIVEAANGLEGITLAHRHRPDVILLDYHMPVMNGYEMALALQQTEATHRIPVVLSTSSDRSEPQVASLHTLCIATIDKSAAFQQLASVLKWAVESTATQAHSEQAEASLAFKSDFAP